MPLSLSPQAARLLAAPLRTKKRLFLLGATACALALLRSEERRVGKECRL